MKKILIGIFLVFLIKFSSFPQVVDFPVNEKTKKISYAEIHQDLELSRNEIFFRLNDWSAEFYDSPIDHILNYATDSARIFIKAYSIFQLKSIENNQPKEYTIRLSYDLRFFIHDGDLRYDITNLYYGTEKKPQLMEAEVLFDDWHVKTSLNEAQNESEKQNIKNAHLQYINNTKIIIEHIIDSFLSILQPY